MDIRHWSEAAKLKEMVEFRVHRSLRMETPSKVDIIAT